MSRILTQAQGRFLDELHNTDVPTRRVMKDMGISPRELTRWKKQKRFKRALKEVISSLMTQVKVDLLRLASAGMQQIQETNGEDDARNLVRMGIYLSHIAKAFGVKVEGIRRAKKKKGQAKEATARMHPDAQGDVQEFLKVMEGKESGTSVPA